MGNLNGNLCWSKLKAKVILTPITNAHYKEDFWVLLTFNILYNDKTCIPPLQIVELNVGRHKILKRINNFLTSITNNAKECLYWNLFVISNILTPITKSTSHKLMSTWLFFIMLAFHTAIIKESWGCYCHESLFVI